MQVAGEFRKWYPHDRSILFIETDLISLQPSIGCKPAALSFEGFIVACNGEARSYGITDHLPFATALELCPGLMVLGAEHLPQLSEAVHQVNQVLRSFSLTLERVSLDECFIDLTGHHLVANVKPRVAAIMREHSWLDRQPIALRLAEQLQHSLLARLGVRCRVGVSASKLLARLAALQGAVGHCGVLEPQDAEKALKFEDARLVFPSSLVTALLRSGIQTTEDVRNLSLQQLQDAVGLENAVQAKNAVCGVDESPVVPSDRWRLLCVEYDIREKYTALLLRLFSQVDDDGRIPLAVKVSVRKLEPTRNSSLKGTLTAPIPSWAWSSAGRTSPETVGKLLRIVMGLFRRLVDTSRPFQLSLLGLAFVRFRDASSRMHHPSVSLHGPASRSMASCLLRKRELSVETPLNICFEGYGDAVTNAPPAQAAYEPPDLDDLTPCEKKAKLDIIIKAQKLGEDEMDVCSPSKLKVADLSLGDKTSPKSRGLAQC